jgi:ribosomal protein S18 acetylase RimI-like enzyme
MNLTIRAARSADADVIAEFNRLLAKETEHKHLDPAILSAGVAAVLGDPNKGRYFVAETDGRIVGQLGITFEWSDWRNGNFWWIQSVFVAPDARRQGVFRTLYQHVLDAAYKDANVIGVRLYVEHDNTIAQATYRKLGMERMSYLMMQKWPL